MTERSENKTDNNVWPADARPVAAAAVDTWADNISRPLPTTRGVLTPAEIEALLRPDIPDDLPVPPEPDDIEDKAIVAFPAQTSADAGKIALESEFGDLAARLSLAFGQNTGVKAALALEETHQINQSELFGLLSGGTGVIACFGQPDSMSDILVCLSPEFADQIIASACGGNGSTGKMGDNWTLSAIDCALLEQLLTHLGRAFGEGVTLQALETDIAYAVSLMPRKRLGLAQFDMTAPGLRTKLIVAKREKEAEPIPATDPTPFSGQPVTAVVSARIASLTVPLSRLTELKAGSTLLLGLPPDQPVEVLSGGLDGPVLFEGEVGRKGKKVAVRIKQRRSGQLDY